METEVKLASNAELYIDFETLTPRDFIKIMDQLDKLYRNLIFDHRRRGNIVRPLEIKSIREGSLHIDFLGNAIVLFTLGKLLDYTVGGITYDAIKFVFRQFNPWSDKPKNTIVEQANQFQETFNKGNYKSAKFTYESPEGERLTVELKR